MARTVALVVCTLLLAASCSAQQNATSPSQNSRNAVLHADMRFLGNQVLPLTDQKQNAIIVGVANVLGGGILASDITLTVRSTYESISATGNRRLLQTYPAADVSLAISTNNDLAGNQSNTLRDASNQTYALASAIGAQGLQTQQIVLQSTNITQNAQTPPPASPSPSPPPTPASTPEGSSASPPPTQTATPSPTSTPAASGTASGSAASASTSSSKGSSLSGGAIAGIVVGALALILLAALAAIWARRRSKMAQQEEVIEYFSGRDKQGPQAGNMIHANSSSHAPTPAVGAAAPTAAPVVRPAPPILNIPNSAINNIDEKVEHGPATEKREVV